MKTHFDSLCEHIQIVRIPNSIPNKQKSGFLFLFSFYSALEAVVERGHWLCVVRCNYNSTAFPFCNAFECVLHRISFDINISTGGASHFFISSNHFVICTDLLSARRRRENKIDTTITLPIECTHILPLVFSLCRWAARTLSTFRSHQRVIGRFWCSK